MDKSDIIKILGSILIIVSPFFIVFDPSHATVAGESLCWFTISNIMSKIVLVSGVVSLIFCLLKKYNIVTVVLAILVIVVSIYSAYDFQGFTTEYTKEYVSGSAYWTASEISDFEARLSLSYVPMIAAVSGSIILLVIYIKSRKEKKLIGEKNV